MIVDQCRMALGALKWSLDDLAAASGVGRATVARFLGGTAVKPELVAAMRAVFEANRVRFIDKGQFAGGVTLVKAG